MKKITKKPKLAKKNTKKLKKISKKSLSLKAKKHVPEKKLKSKTQKTLTKLPKVTSDKKNINPSKAKTQPPVKEIALKQKAPATQKSTVSKRSTSYLFQLENELESILEKTRSVSIKDSEGHEYCMEENCDQKSTTIGYCRYHYMASWDKIKNKNLILNDKKLDQWVSIIVNSYSTKVLDYMIRDLSNEKDFSSALSDMKIS